MLLKHKEGKTMDKETIDPSAVEFATLVDALNEAIGNIEQEYEVNRKRLNLIRATVKNISKRIDKIDYNWIYKL